MTVMFHDIKQDKELQEELDRHKILGTLFDELLYADDTMLIGSNKKSVEALLHAVENQSNRYSMNLNKGKCETLAINYKGKLHFKNGESKTPKRQRT